MVICIYIYNCNRFFPRKTAQNHATTLNLVFQWSSLLRICRFIGHLFLLLLSRLVKSIWLFFPVSFLSWCWLYGVSGNWDRARSYCCFYRNHRPRSPSSDAIAFWVYVSWFSARIIAYLKKKQTGRLSITRLSKIFLLVRPFD